MAERLQVYECKICGNIVEVLRGGKGKLVCCGQPMELLVEQTADWATEKHVPALEGIDGRVRVKVGATVAHPMTEQHFIEWIEVITADGIAIRFLKPGDAPEAIFNLTETEIQKSREHCNIHSLWAFTK